MPRDLDVELSDVLIEDDSSRHRDTLTPEQMKPRYTDNVLPSADNGMTEDDKDAVDAMLSPRRRGFVEGLLTILKKN